MYSYILQKYFTIYYLHKLVSGVPSENDTKKTNENTT